MCCRGAEIVLPTASLTSNGRRNEQGVTRLGARLFVQTATLSRCVGPPALAGPTGQPFRAVWGQSLATTQLPVPLPFGRHPDYHIARIDITRTKVCTASLGTAPSLGVMRGKCRVRIRTRPKFVEYRLDLWMACRGHDCEFLAEQLWGRGLAEKNARPSRLWWT
jgi:hypothetical protein